MDRGWRSLNIFTFFLRHRGISFPIERDHQHQKKVAGTLGEMLIRDKLFLQKKKIGAISSQKTALHNPRFFKMGLKGQRKAHTRDQMYERYSGRE